ncbi:hypothetical protein BJ878DRAFT_416245 [Calycina marina]|uniref:Uncharacterized protein n=1 Tax=Calycina marina TaxID=1763456 RepID=A0A9P8CIR2_9HELO|nr:hypothetical protein BJ878DRAFT_416245 [Calycina marina]
MDKKGRGVRQATGKSPIAAPPRVAVQGRSKAEHHDDSTSTKSTKSTIDGTGSEEEGESDVKDERIAYLEKELATMEDEFQRELTQLSHKSTNESETAVFWQQKHSALNQTFLKADTDLRLLRQDLYSFQQDSDKRDCDIKTRISSLMLDRDAFREAYSEACADIKAKDDLIKMLQGQVWGLKSFVSTSSKMDEQIADEAFGEQMQRLGNSTQNWVITNFRKAKLNLDKANSDTKENLLHLVPTYDTLATISKIHLIQAIVSRLLLNTIFEEYFVGLPRSRATELRDIEKYLRSFGSTESTNQWRSTTLALIRKEATSKLATETSAVTEFVIKTVNDITSSISNITPSDVGDESLRAIVTSSIELSRLLRVQKAVLTVIMPVIEGYQRTMFDAKTMEDIGGEDEETLFEREIRCVTFPGIIKAGDENGEKVHLRNVVLKMTVLCAPD